MSVNRSEPGGLGLFLVLGSVTAIGAVAMDSYLPGLPEMARDFGTSQAATQLTITTFFIGLALGQLVSGPLSDVHGRRRPMIAGMALFAVASVACAVSPSLWVLALMRVVEGIAAATGVVVGRAVVRDLYAGAAAARYLSRLILIVGLGPILAPVLGAQVLRVTSWRGSFVALAAIGVILTFVAARYVPETLAPERRRAAGIGMTVRTSKGLFRERRFVGFMISVGLGSGAVVAYIAASSFVLQDVYGASPQLYGLLFGASAVFMVVGAQANAHLVSRHPVERLAGFGLLMMVAAGLLLLIVSVAHAGGIPALLPAFMLLLLSWSFVQSNLTALALTDHPEIAGTAAAMIGVSQFLIAGVTAPLPGLGGGGSGVPLGIVITLCGVGALAAFTLLVRPTQARVAVPHADTADAVVGAPSG